MSQMKYDWPFAYSPYDIQKDFMNELYDTLDNGGIGIFESPTGTGKSLSIICSALHWLREHRGIPTTTKKEENANATSSEPDWIQKFKTQHENDERNAAIERHKERQARVMRYRDSKQIGALKKRKTLEKKDAKRKNRRMDETSDDEFAPDYSDDDELSSFQYEDQFDDDSDVDLEYTAEGNGPKIFFCSRTHSQLSQFMNEIARTTFAKDIACLALGSRNQLCVNPKVKTPGSSNATVNDKCLDLFDRCRKDKKDSKRATDAHVSALPKQSACPFFDRSALSKLKDYILFEPQDIEKVAALGVEQHACSYFASRYSVQDAEFISLPYPMLLHKETRDSLGISLKGNVVIFDEAHNLIEAVNNVYSSVLSMRDLARAHMEVSEYQNRYQTRLGPKNAIGVNNLLVFIRGLLNYLRNLAKSLSDQAVTVTSGELAIQAKIDHINLFDIIAYMKDSRLAIKLRGFAEKYIHAKNGSLDSVKAAEIKPVEYECRASALQSVLTFLDALTNTSHDGKVLMSKSPTQGCQMKFINFNPATYFREIVEDAHSVILAGGTMQPTEDVTSQLFSSVPPSRMHLFSCGHVIPKEHMTCVSLSCGPTKKPLEFTFNNRSQPEMIDEAGRVIVNICNLVRGGIIVFLPSYSYEKEIFSRWEQSGILETLKKKTSVFRETRNATNMESTLEAYGATCAKGNALLLSVVGGKLSEGINFKDHLARCVIMLGLPFPNMQDPELQAKVKYLEKERVKIDEYYENQCMKAVNQCIGRAIRHRNDYAAIVLMDARYRTSRIHNKLPKWVANSTAHVDGFPKFIVTLRQFFHNIEQNKSFI